LIEVDGSFVLEINDEVCVSDKRSTGIVTIAQKIGTDPWGVVRAPVSVHIMIKKPTKHDLSVYNNDASRRIYLQA